MWLNHEKSTHFLSHSLSNLTSSNFMNFKSIVVESREKWVFNKKQLSSLLLLKKFKNHKILSHARSMLDNNN